MIKLFFRGVRAVLGPILLASEKLFPAKPLPAASLKQEELEKAQDSLALYQFKACPFCIKVRQQSKRVGLNLETRNVLKNPAWHDELQQQGGKRKVPCLRIVKDDGKIEWLYESKAINNYLIDRFAV